MRIVDYRWTVKVTGLKGVNTLPELKKWLTSKNIHSGSFITFVGHAFPATVLGFKEMVFSATIQAGADTATISLRTMPGEMMADLNNPTIAFETSLSRFNDAGIGEYTIGYIIPVPISDACQVTKLVCL